METSDSRQQEIGPNQTWNILLFVILMVRILGPSGLKFVRNAAASPAQGIRGIPEGRDVPAPALSFVDLRR